MRRVIAGMLVMAVATAAAAAREAIGLCVDPDGVRLVLISSGSTSAIPFGTPRAQTLSAMASQGRPQLGTSGDCDAGPLQYATYPGGLTLDFQRGRFVGWSADIHTGRGVTTMAGIGPGSTRAQLRKAYDVKVERGEAGMEFSVGNMSGLINGPGPNARITSLWAGTTCQAM